MNQLQLAAKNMYPFKLGKTVNRWQVHKNMQPVSSAGKTRNRCLKRGCAGKHVTGVKRGKKRNRCQAQEDM